MNPRFILAALLAVPPRPAKAEPGPHDRGLERRDAGDPIGAAEQWLRAFDAAPLTVDARDDIKNHFCEAVQSLTDASADSTTRTAVGPHIDVRRTRLADGARFIERHNHPTDVAICLQQWAALAHANPPAVEPAPPPIRDEPPPPETRHPRGLQIATYATLGFTALVTAAALGTGLSLLHNGHDRDGFKGAAYQATYDAAPDTSRDDLCVDIPSMTPDLVDACRTYHRVETAAITTTALAVVGVIASSVLGGVLARRNKLHRHAEIRRGVALVTGLTSLQIRVNF